ncbi:LysR family transcriptional regulator [Ideonella sp. 4Y11]|uniref:LysR family transcriptional regulator n=1 Tax=Ideonella aquatica TaxID=2824119 RepID=A0A941BKW8_9BURK|nr:LysR family transcriptional regulator [Ideonella aquatica]MBQ0960897.1 LysR family transcriptional regulator [Ideonella aquatica]
MRFNRLDLNLLVALDALLTERSVTRAAVRLNLSPSATSDALARLREYFDDELLVQVGRKMEPTPRAEALQQPVRDVLVRVDSTIATQPDFDPARSERVFRVFASDYTQMVIGPQVMALAAGQGARVRIDFLPQIAQPHRSLERGEADLLVLPQALLSAEHPSEVLYQERFVCAVWQDGALARGALTRERYLAAGHVVMHPQDAASASYEDWFITRLGVARRIVASSYGFATVPGLLVGTDHVATMHERLARLFLSVWPLVVRPCPIEIPPMQQAVQWHKYRRQDQGIAWLRGLFTQAAAVLPPSQREPA